MEFEYVVAEDFAGYRAGQVISDADEIARLEASPRNLANVTRRLAPPAPPAAPKADPKVDGKVDPKADAKA